MAAISQTIFSDTFSWMKCFVCWFKFHWSLFLRVQLTITSNGLDNGLAPNRRQAIIWTNADPIHRRIYAALEGGELTVPSQTPRGKLIIFIGRDALNPVDPYHSYRLSDPVYSIMNGDTSLAIDNGNSASRQYVNQHLFIRNIGHTFNNQ